MTSASTIMLVMAVASALALTAVLGMIFGIDVVQAFRGTVRRGIVGGLGPWPMLGLVAMIALVVNHEGSVQILSFVCPPGHEAEVRWMMPRAVAVFLAGGVFLVAAGAVLRTALPRPSKTASRRTNAAL